uniref:NAD(P)H-hydrate dehydratase n=1 Tax=Thaumasiovibrio occultus TaxID=1891184 RepID=UPI000B357249|nr:NAD(P)H-hydrate dehydratase [Thaumasiovibrio occultus]
MYSVSLSLPHSLYASEQVKHGEKQVAKRLELPMYTLMERAGAAAFELLTERFGRCQRILICCGTGNNGGDGYVVARLAKTAGLDVTVWQIGDVEKLPEDALLARTLWLDDGGAVAAPESSIALSVDCVVDAMLGTGLSSAAREPFSTVIAAINHSAAKVLSIDVPSGLNADTGHAPGAVIKADATITFVGVKRGLMTAAAADHCGELHFCGLGIEAEFSSLIPANCLRVMPTDVEPYLLPRRRCAHKGDHGRLLCAGGDLGTGGAIGLASEAALHTGAGLVSVLTQPEHITYLLTRRPELMVLGWQDKAHVVAQQMAWADAIVLGPGLGQGDWGQALYFHLKETEKSLVLDADGLNLLALNPDYNANRILTPHPGEAARLLACTVAEVEADRFSAVVRLQQKYGGVVLLKGAGSLVYDGEQCWLVSAGNPGMATGGMGDVLSGILGALIAQGLSLSQAAVAGAWIHSRAGDLCSIDGERGMIASDLYSHIRQLVNPDRHDSSIQDPT